ncbi:MAG: hypothetical protein ACRDZ4_05630 [Egibacteraceae bacterium]
MASTVEATRDARAEEGVRDVKVAMPSNEDVKVAKVAINTGNLGFVVA